MTINRNIYEYKKIYNITLLMRNLIILYTYIYNMVFISYI